MVGKIITTVFTGNVTGIQIIDDNDDVIDDNSDKIMYSSHPELNVVRRLVDWNGIYCQGDSDVCNISSDFVIMLFLELNNTIGMIILVQNGINGFCELYLPTSISSVLKRSVLHLRSVVLNKYCQVIPIDTLYPLITGSNKDVKLNKYMRLALTLLQTYSDGKVDNIERFRGKFMHLVDKYLWDANGDIINIRWVDRQLLPGGTLHKSCIMDINNTLVISLSKLEGCNLDTFTDTQVKNYFTYGVILTSSDKFHTNCIDDNSDDSDDDDNFNFDNWTHIMNKQLTVMGSNISIEKQHNEERSDIIAFVNHNQQHNIYRFTIKVDGKPVKHGILLSNKQDTITLFELTFNYVSSNDYNTVIEYNNNINSSQPIIGDDEEHKEHEEDEQQDTKV